MRVLRYLGQPMTVGRIGLCCGLIGILCWIGYGHFATRAIFAVIAHQRATADRFVTYAGRFQAAQLISGISSIGLGWTARARGEESRSAGRIGFSSVCLGIIALMLSMVFV
jgi:hypothetical protein